MARKKRLPKGLQEFLGTLALTDQYTAELLGRLKDLPGSKKTPLADVIAKWEDLHVKQRLLEELAAKARKEAREYAVDIFEECLKKWTTKQLQRATGYTDE